MLILSVSSSASTMLVVLGTIGSALAVLTIASRYQLPSVQRDTCRSSETDRDGAYDLDQLPDGRPRYVAAGRPLFGLTAHMRMVWSPSVDRGLHRSELAATMGVPCHPALSIAYGLPPMSFDHLSRSAAAILIGNGMVVPCFGSVMHWCAVFCLADVVVVPRGLNDSSVDYHAALESTDLVFASDQTLPDHTLASASASTWKVLRSLGSALCEHSMFAELANSLRSATKPLDRERELFPLPIISVDFIGQLSAIASGEIDDVREYLLGVVVGLNWLYGFRGHAMALGSPSSAQRAAHDVVIAAAIDFHSRLVASFDSCVDGGWRNFEDKDDAPRLTLIASAVAVPDCAATCTPATFINGELGRAISVATVVFPSPPDGFDIFPTSTAASAVSMLL